MTVPREFLPTQYKYLWLDEDSPGTVRTYLDEHPEAEYCDFAINNDDTLSALVRMVDGA